MVVSNKNKILNLLEKEALTISEISEKISFVQDKKNNENNVRTYVQRLLSEKRIVETGEKKDGFIVYSINKDSPGFAENVTKSLETQELKKLLLFLNSFFVNNVDFLIKNKKIDAFIVANESVFNKIEEVLSNGK